MTLEKIGAFLVFAAPPSLVLLLIEAVWHDARRQR